MPCQDMPLQGIIPLCPHDNHCLSRLLTCRLPVQAISLDFLGVPGSAVASKTLDLVEKHGFPSEKRLGAGVVDGRSVWSDGAVPAALVASLHKKVHVCALLPAWLCRFCICC